MTMQPILDQIKQLSFAEKLQLVEDLWDAIADEATKQPLSEPLRAELLRRLEEHRLRPDTPLEWDEVKAELARRLA